MRTELKLSAALLGLVALTGCLDNPLDVTNPNQITTETFWKTQADAVNATNGLYAILYSRGMWGRNRYDFWGRSDVIMSRSPAGNIQAALRGVVTDYNYTGFLSGIWNDPYQGVFRANQVIARVPKMSLDATVTSTLVAQAKFIRALMYFHQTLIFKNIPLILDEVDANFQPKFTPQADVYKQVIKDASDAAAVLPWVWTGADKGRATKGAALALAAEANMMLGNWQAAADMLQQIVDSNQYHLLPNYVDLFTIPAGEQSVESLFEVAFGDQNAYIGGAYGNIWPRLIGPQTGNCSTCGSLGFSDQQPTQWAFDLFFQDGSGPYPTNEDPRLDVSIFWNRPGGMDVFGTAFATRYAKTGPGGGAGYYDQDLNHTFFFKKYQEYWLTQLANFANPINYKIYRMGQIYIMLAEARVELGNVAAAKAAVDVVRARAGVPPMPAGLIQDSARMYVNREAARELFAEGHTRLAYLLRHNWLTKAYLTPRNPFHASQFVDGHNDYMPIPQPEMNLNPNAVQNPGW